MRNLRLLLPIGMVIIFSFLAYGCSKNPDIIEEPVKTEEETPTTPEPQTPTEEPSEPVSGVTEDIPYYLPATQLSKQSTPEQREIIGSANEFSFRLFNKAFNNPAFGSEDEGGVVTYDVSNISLSPLSVQFSLGMVGNYVKNEVSLCEMLGFEEREIEGVNEYYKNLMGLLSENGQNGMSIANALMRDTLSVPFKKDFINVLKDYYSADYQCFEAYPLAELAPGSRPEDIWVREKTNGMIKSAPLPILQRGYSLFNVISFKGDWTDKFLTENTKSDFFHKDASTDIMLPTMRQTNYFAYYKDSVFSSVSMTLSEGNYLLTVLLPDEEKGVSDIIGELNSESWNALRKGLLLKKVEIHIPKFEMTFSHNHIFNLLDDKYQTDYTEELDRMFKEDPANTHLLNKIAQKTFFSIDENGASAAAVTQVGPATDPYPWDPIVFKVDHPFVYVLSETGSGLIVFLGVFSGKDTVLE